MEIILYISSRGDIMRTEIGYKLFRIKKSDPGKLFPLYVLSNEEIPMHTWIHAKCGEKVEGKVKSRLGLLKFRPGFHINDRMPYVSHIGVKENGVIKFMHPDTVWCEVVYRTEIDYNEEARECGWNEDHTKYNDKAACLDKIPKNGFYYYKTSPSMTGKWVISGEMKVNRIIPDDEVSKICSKYGYEALPRREVFNITEYGFVA